MVYLTLCLWEEIGLVWPGPTIAKIPSIEQDGVFNVMSMGRNWSSLAWMTTTQKFPPPNKMVYLTLCLWEEIGLVWSGSTIAKIPSTEQDGVFNIMSMGRNWSSLAWMTTNFNTFVLFFFCPQKVVRVVY